MLSCCCAVAWLPAEMAALTGQVVPSSSDSLTFQLPPVKSRSGRSARVLVIRPKGFASDVSSKSSRACAGKLIAHAVAEDAGSSTTAASLKPKLVSQGSKLVGCGSAVPKLIVSNDDLAQIVDTSDEWIYTRTGIHNRRILSGDENLTSLAIEASKKALQMAQVAPDDVDLILLCTSTPDDAFGAGPQISRGLGCKNNLLATDIRAACSGFLLGLLTASAYIKALGYQNVLVVGADALSKYVDWTDRGSCILFGDAAGAVLVQACDIDEDALLSYDVHSDGEGHRHLNGVIKYDKKEEEILSSNGAVTFPPRSASYSRIRMNGKEVFRFAVGCVPQSIATAIEKAGLTVSNIDWLLLHQANQRIIDAVASCLEIPSENVISNLANYGNTSAASIPLALDEAVRSGKVKAGDTIAMAGFGAGLTWGSAIVKWL